MRPDRDLLILALACLAPSPTLFGQATPPPEQKARPSGAIPADKAKARFLSGRIVDGLGSPVPGAKLTLRQSAFPVKPPLLVVWAGGDGRFTCPIPRDAEGLWLDVAMEGYSNISMSADPRAFEDVTLLRKIDWGEAAILRHRKAGELDAGIREILASEEWFSSDDALEKFLFNEQAVFRPAMRRLIGDAQVGKSARSWLDMLGDPGDRDLFPEGRKSAPKHDIRENDLVEAIKAISRRLNFFSSSPEPEITIDFIAFNSKMDHALVKCGINLAPFTGVIWRFVFYKDGPRWVLRSTQEAGRG
jgi:hypothetical protein